MSKGPTILQIIPELDTGGAELSTLEIASAVVSAGGRALVLSEGGRLVARIEKAGGVFIPFPAATKNPLRILWNARRIADFVREESVDLIHARSRAPAWSALMAARDTGVPFVTTYHGAYNETNALKRWYNSVMARGDIVIANSCYTRDLIQARYGTDSGKVRVIYRGVDGETFDPGRVSDARVAALRESWKLGAGARIILQAARLTGWKGQSVVVEAMRLLKARGQLGDAVVVMAGDAQGRSDYVSQLRNQIAANGLEHRVLLVGHVDDIPAAFKAAHLAVVASTEPEAFGRAATEAQAMACPVIATRLGAPPETVLSGPEMPQDKRTGWLVPPSEAEALAGAMAEALTLDLASRADMGGRARAHVLSAFALETMRRQTLDVYEELLGQKFEQAA